MKEFGSFAIVSGSLFSFRLLHATIYVRGVIGKNPAKPIRIFFQHYSSCFQASKS